MTDEHTLAVRPHADIVPSRADAEIESATGLMRMAIEKGVGADQLAVFRDILRDIRESRARSEYNAALVAVLDDAEAVPKTGTVKYQAGRGGDSVAYTHYKLEEVERVLSAPCRAHGVGYSMSDEITDNKTVRVRLVIRARDYREEYVSEGPAASASPGMDALKVNSSTITILRKRALIQGFGLRGMTEPDLDNQELHAPSGTITDEQAEKLDELCTKAEANMERFFSMFRCSSLATFPASRYREAVAKLNQQIAAKGTQ